MSVQVSWKRWLLPVAVFVACLAIDQWSKKIATDTIRDADTMSFLNDMLRIKYAENPGAFLGAGAALSATTRFWLLVVVNACFLMAVTVVMLRRPQMPRLQQVALVLLLAGGIGNLVDRVFHDGLVIDFLNVGIGGLRTGIFNVADMAIMAGFALLIFSPASARAADAHPACDDSFRASQAMTG